MTAARRALIVATGEYEDDRLKPLSGPQRDAEALQSVLASAEIGGFEVEVAMNPRLDSLRRTLEAFFSDRARDDLLLVHFSGHGLKDDDGQLFLAASDTRIDRLLSTGLEASWVNRLITRSRSESIALFLDCCFAGAFATSLERRTGVDTAGVKETFRGTGRYVITASDAMQYSFEGGQQVGQAPEPSPFTHALVEGLATGEADRNEDGNVSINELFDYLEERVRQFSPSQTPTKSAVNQVGDWVIARSTRVPSIQLLSSELLSQLKSENPIDRSLALEPLLRLVSGSDDRIRQAARHGLELLADDDSRRLAEAARRYLAQLDQPGTPPVIVALPAPESAATSTPRAANAGQPPARRPTAEIRRDQPGSTIRRPGTQSVPPQSAPPTGPSTQPSAGPSDAPAALPASHLASRPAASGALWGPATSSAVEAVPSAPDTVTGWSTPAPPQGQPAQAPTLSAGFNWRRSIGRAIIGVFVGAVLNSAIWAFSYYRLGFFWVISAAVVVALFVAILERYVGAVRIPDGIFFALVGRNRWLASAAMGAAAGFATYLPLRADALIILLTPIGFVIGEALVGKRFTRSAPVQPKAA